MKPINYTNNDTTIYQPCDIDKVIDIAVNEKNIKGKSNGQRYYNIPASFDIETSSFYRDEDGKTYTYEQVAKLENKNKLEKVSLCYIWQLGINGRTIIGRELSEFIDVCTRISERLELSDKLRLIIYIHNLSYEFQFIRECFTWNKVFAMDNRKPLYAITDNNIEFRCSYLLSGYNLAKLGEQLQKYKVSKLVGDLDYSKIRHAKTELTDKEISYCVNDIKVVQAYIMELIEQYKGIQYLPLTKTGFVRNYCRKQCLRYKDAEGKQKVNYRYIDLMKELEINGLTEFNMLQRAFAGGFTHANANYTEQVLYNVSSYDFTSSYPAVMVSEQFPMSRGIKINVKNLEQFRYILDNYCCIFDIRYNNIFPKVTHEHPISVSKCISKDNHVEDNGRLVCAKSILMTITNIDFNIYEDFYTYDNIEVGTMYVYKKGYLPTEFIKSILHLYEKKTTLKGVEGSEVEYLNSKEMLNSCYGMSVTNPLRDEYTYIEEWGENHLSTEEQGEQLYKYNTNKKRFLFYPWGVFITAYSRANLFTAIKECGDDYVYSDTDSVKILNAEKHKDYFNKYNNDLHNKLRNACKFHGLPFDLCEPKTIKGITKTLGVWDFEGVYKRFKTLGAKRYVVEEKNALRANNGQMYDFSLTISGVNKKVAIPWLIKTYGEGGIFDAVSNYLDLPPEGCGKNIHTYIDYRQAGEVTDYNGVTSTFDTLTGVHLEPTGYTLNLSILYLKYLQGIKHKE